MQSKHLAPKYSEVKNRTAPISAIINEGGRGYEELPSL